MADRTIVHAHNAPFLRHRSVKGLSTVEDLAVVELVEHPQGKGWSDYHDRLFNHLVAPSLVRPERRYGERLIHPCVVESVADAVTDTHVWARDGPLNLHSGRKA